MTEKQSKMAANVTRSPVTRDKSHEKTRRSSEKLLKSPVNSTIATRRTTLNELLATFTEEEINRVPTDWSEKIKNSPPKSANQSKNTLAIANENLSPIAFPKGNSKLTSSFRHVFELSFNEDTEKTQSNITNQSFKSKPLRSNDSRTNLVEKLLAPSNRSKSSANSQKRAHNKSSSKGKHGSFFERMEAFEKQKSAKLAKLKKKVEQERAKKDQEELASTLPFNKRSKSGTPITTANSSFILQKSERSSRSLEFQQKVKEFLLTILPSQRKQRKRSSKGASLTGTPTKSKGNLSERAHTTGASPRGTNEDLKLLQKASKKISSISDCSPKKEGSVDRSPQKNKINQHFNQSKSNALEPYHRRRSSCVSGVSQPCLVRSINFELGEKLFLQEEEANKRQELIFQPEPAKLLKPSPSLMFMRSGLNRRASFVASESKNIEKIAEARTAHMTKNRGEFSERGTSISLKKPGSCVIKNAPLTARPLTSHDNTPNSEETLSKIAAMKRNMKPVSLVKPGNHSKASTTSPSTARGLDQTDRSSAKKVRFSDKREQDEVAKGQGTVSRKNLNERVPLGANRDSFKPNTSRSNSQSIDTTPRNISSRRSPKRQKKSSSIVESLFPEIISNLMNEKRYEDQNTDPRMQVMPSREEYNKKEEVERTLQKFLKDQEEKFLLLEKKKNQKQPSWR